MKELSLIITVFNRSHLIRKALLSLKNQSFSPNELIISDDGSEENIPENISDIVNQLDFKVKYIKQINDGFRLARCRNNGVRESTGDFLIFLDQDLIHTPNYLRTFTEHIAEKRFLTSFPVYLSEEESKSITEDTLSSALPEDIITPIKRNGVYKQYIRDRLGYYIHKLKLERKPKLRGGACGINKEDFELINGYDEKYVGWGNEDDDVGRRLYQAGIHGFNPFKDEYPIHLYHEPFHVDKERVNLEYDAVRDTEVKGGDFRCRIGLDTEDKSDILEIKDLN